ncbi:MAG: ABC transporter ATP-binding protein [Thermoleophilaceae bacterium]|nr:ABC transporter ATP-binding protein [Thermoleophilaceae bacterium]
MTGPAPTPPAALLSIRALRVDLRAEGELRRVIHDVTLDVAEGESVGLVGESGSGKSMTARAVARLLPEGAVTGGEIVFDGEPVLTLRGAALRRFRRGGIATIFQDPAAHINPVRTIGDHLTEGLRLVRGVDAREAERRAAAMLGEVGIAGGERRLRQHPHELSGGMLQRVMIASVLLDEPRLILADEPTTALDVTTQSEVMALLSELSRERRLAMLYITHDLELAAGVCDRTAVMYAGAVMEVQRSAALNDGPLNPYTAALLAARPRVDARSDRLEAIAGRPRSAFEAPEGCVFADRCPHVEDACVAERQELRPLAGGLVRCRRAEELRGRLGHA